jgi:hypothetical protein
MRRPGRGRFPALAGGNLEVWVEHGVFGYYTVTRAEVKAQPLNRKVNRREVAVPVMIPGYLRGLIFTGVGF